VVLKVVVLEVLDVELGAVVAVELDVVLEEVEARLEEDEDVVVTGVVETIDV
jgi:hypothetical protein